jgi:membrane protease YdiL (CAAX protease family)
MIEMIFETKLRENLIRPIKRYYYIITIFGIYLFYTIFQIINLILLDKYAWRDSVVAIISSILCVLAISVLILSGYSLPDCFLEVKKISIKGFFMLFLSIAITLPSMLPFGKYIGWNWLQGLIYAPISGITQELFFRSTLLPVILILTKEKKYTAIILHTILFGIWHMGIFWIAPWFIGIAVVLVPVLAGFLWAMQTIRDGTVFYAIFTHSLILIISSLFIW